MISDGGHRSGVHEKGCLLKKKGENIGRDYECGEMPREGANDLSDDPHPRTREKRKSKK